MSMDYRCDACRKDGGTYCSTYTDENGVYRKINKPYVFCEASERIWAIPKVTWDIECANYEPKHGKKGKRKWKK